MHSNGHNPFVDFKSEKNIETYIEKPAYLGVHVRAREKGGTTLNSTTAYAQFPA